MSESTDPLEAPEQQGTSSQGARSSWLVWVVAISLMVALAGFGTLLVWLFFFVLTPETAATMFIGSLTVVGSVAVTLWTTSRRRKADIERDHRKQRSEFYQELFKHLSTVFVTDDIGIEKPDDNESAQELNKFTWMVMLWGSPQMIKSWGGFRRSAINYGRDADTRIMMHNTEKFLLDIREDLGHSNEGLQFGDLLDLFVNDLREQLEGADPDAPTSAGPGEGG